jgi:hypothetical protein
VNDLNRCRALALETRNWGQGICWPSAVQLPRLLGAFCQRKGPHRSRSRARRFCQWATGSESENDVSRRRFIFFRLCASSFNHEQTCNSKSALNKKGLASAASDRRPRFSAQYQVATVRNCLQQFCRFCSERNNLKTVCNKDGNMNVIPRAQAVRQTFVVEHKGWDSPSCCFAPILRLINAVVWDSTRSCESHLHPPPRALRHNVRNLTGRALFKGRTKCLNGMCA